MHGFRTFWKRRTTIRARIFLAMLVEAMLVLPVVAMSVFYFNGVARSVQQMVAEDALASRLAEEIAKDIRDVQRSERVYLATKDPTALALVREGLMRMKGTLDRLQGLGEDSGGRYTRIEKRIGDYAKALQLLAGRAAGGLSHIGWRALRNKMAAFRKEQTRLEAAGEADRDSLLAGLGRKAVALDLIGALEATAMVWDPEMEQFMQDLAEYGDEIDSLAEDVSNRRWEMLLNQKNRAILLGEQAKRNILTVLMVTLILSGYFIFVFPRRAVAPIRQIANIIQQAERGTFSSLATVQSGDEIGEISRMFNRLITQVRAFDALKARHILVSHRRLQAVGEMASEGVIVLKETLRVDYINRQARELLGWEGEHAPDKLEEVEGAEDLVRAVTKCVSASEDRQEAVIALGRVRPAAVRCHLHRLSIPDGTWGGVVILLQLPTTSAPDRAPTSGSDSRRLFP